MSEETRKILKKLEVGTTYSGVDVICRQYKEIERLNNIINETKKILLLNFDTTTTIFNALNKLSEVDK